jgi:hypothetical protein
MSEREVTEVAVGVLVRPDGQFLLTTRPHGKVYADLTVRFHSLDQVANSVRC